MGRIAKTDIFREEEPALTERMRFCSLPMLCVKLGDVWFYQHLKVGSRAESCMIFDVSMWRSRTPYTECRSVLVPGVPADLSTGRTHQRAAIVASCVHEKLFEIDHQVLEDRRRCYRAKNLGVIQQESTRCRARDSLEGPRGSKVCSRGGCRREETHLRG